MSSPSAVSISADSAWPLRRNGVVVGQFHGGCVVGLELGEVPGGCGDLVEFRVPPGQLLGPAGVSVDRGSESSSCTGHAHRAVR